MLVLTRHIGQAIIMGDDIIVTVLGIQDNRARIGITAPKDISIHREEIYLKIQAEGLPEPSDS